MRKLHETGICTIAVVCDGTATNRSVLNKLDVIHNSDKVLSWFIHPADKNSKIYCIFDAAHMLKLTRNLLADKKILINGTSETNFNKIKLVYLENLIAVQEKEGLHAANKLTITYSKNESWFSC